MEITRRSVTRLLKDSKSEINSEQGEAPAEAEKHECELLESFLPEPISESELKRVIRTKIREIGASGPKDMGRLMSEVMKHVKGRTDGKIVNSLVRDILAG